MSGPGLDLDVLGRYLEGAMPGFRRLERADKFEGGQSNPTYLLTAASGRYVLRKQPAGRLLPSAHAVDREFRVMSALAGGEVPVPAVLHLCEDPALLDGMFYVMAWVDGRQFWDPALPEVATGERRAIYDDMNRVLAALHDVDIRAAGLGDYGKPGNYFGRQVHRWTEQYRASETGTIDAMDRLIEWLPEHLPADDGQVSLIHGDYRLDNLLFATDRPAVVAVLDWELSTLGHPYADLAYQCMQLRIDRDAIVPGLGGVDRGELGIPDEDEYVADYCRRRGLPGIDGWDFCLAFSFFRLAAILQGVKKRALDGNASSNRALRYGNMAPALAAMGGALID